MPIRFPFTSHADCLTLWNRKHHFRNYKNCFVGCELVDWLVLNEKIHSRTSAQALAQAMYNSKLIVCATTLMKNCVNVILKDTLQNRFPCKSAKASKTRKCSTVSRLEANQSPVLRCLPIRQLSFPSLLWTNYLQEVHRHRLYYLVVLFYLT